MFSRDISDKRSLLAGYAENNFSGTAEQGGGARGGTYPPNIFRIINHKVAPQSLDLNDHSRKLVAH